MQWTVGDNARFRDSEGGDWIYGTVTRTEPNVKFRGKSTPKKKGSDIEWGISDWNFVEKVEVYIAVDAIHPAACSV